MTDAQIRAHRYVRDRLLASMPQQKEAAAPTAIAGAKGLALAGTEAASTLLPIIIGVALLSAPLAAAGAGAIHSSMTSPDEQDAKVLQKRLLLQQGEENLSTMKRRSAMAGGPQGSAEGRQAGNPELDREVRI